MKQIIGFAGQSEQPKRIVAKHPYVPAQRINDTLSDAQKRGAQLYNSMRQMLIDHNLMEEKDGK